MKEAGPRTARKDASQQEVDSYTKLYGNPFKSGDRPRERVFFVPHYRWRNPELTRACDDILKGLQA